MQTLIVSSSQLSTYLECKFKHKLAYEMLLEPKRDEGNVMDKGTDIHRLLEYKTRTLYPHLTPGESPAATDEAFITAQAWWDNVGEAKEATKKRVLAVEQPIYTPINIPSPLGDDVRVFLRCTFDQIYLDKEGWVVGLDYKTFSSFQPWDVDLDFQGRLYTAALGFLFPDYKVRFEYERIRQVGIPGNPRGSAEWVDGEWWVYNKARDKRKRAEIWTKEECYETISLVCGKHEIDTLWTETERVVEELMIRRQVDRWPREYSKMGCKMCYHKDLCKADIQGTLDEGTIELLANKRQPLEIPPELLGE